MQAPGTPRTHTKSHEMQVRDVKNVGFQVTSPQGPRASDLFKANDANTDTVVISNPEERACAFLI